MAACLAMKNNTSPNKLDVKDVQRIALGKGLVLHR